MSQRHLTTSRSRACSRAGEGSYATVRDQVGPFWHNFGSPQYVKPVAGAADVKADEAQCARQYLDALRRIAAGVDDGVFVYGVDFGIGRSGKVLRRLPPAGGTTASAVTDAVIAHSATPKR